MNPFARPLRRWLGMPMIFKAQYPGRYLSMTVVGHAISIHDSQFLQKGETMERPRGAFIMFVAEEPEPDEKDRE